MARREPEEHLKSNVLGMRPSATVAINEHSNALLAEGRKVFKLGMGQSPFPVPELVVDALRRHAHEKDYLPVRGLYDLRRAVAHYTERTAGIDRTAEDVLVGPGSKQLTFLLQLVFDGDIVVPTPAWGSYAPQARLLGRRIELVATSRENGWMLSPEQLDAIGGEREGKRRLVILNYPGNPTGSTFKVEQLKALAKVAERHRTLLLSDEIYGELHHKGQHVSIARYYPEGTIISGGLSKWCGAGGWRLGTFVFPESLRWLLDAMSAAASEIYTSTSAPIQYAAIAAYEGSGDIERYLGNARRILAALGRWCARKLRSVGIDCPQPVGGFYLFPHFGALAAPLAARGIGSSRELCRTILAETGVAILPGVELGRAEEELSARLAYVDFNGARALEAVAVIPREQPLDETFLRRHCGRVVEAIVALTTWAAAAQEPAGASRAVE